MKMRNSMIVRSQSSCQSANNLSAEVNASQKGGYEDTVDIV